jgi:gluconokinase
MGVSGSGKTTIAERLATRLGYHFAEGDDFHPAANIAKMSRDEPLTDADRAPWLAAIHAYAAARLDAGDHLVITCSALKHRYREVLLAGIPDARVIYLRGTRPVIADRLRTRHGHFFPAALLDTQLSALEEPTAAENPLTVDIGPSPDTIVTEIIHDLDAASP